MLIDKPWVINRLTYTRKTPSTSPGPCAEIVIIGIHCKRFNLLERFSAELFGEPLRDIAPANAEISQPQVTLSTRTSIGSNEILLPCTP